MKTTGYVAPKIETFSTGDIVEALGPVLAQGYAPPSQPCQNYCSMCANYCGFSGGC